ncbi:aspartate aminotransferase family protein [Cohnella massiliensis]|uniref:aspartate aminotransferase family protein n=1 Tax=Cohnella massiliensis TaxID=1816691 RepID=UPI0009BA34B3|nr:aspartate aminotransferase family protein [Cohnella massiliensis]
MRERTVRPDAAISDEWGKERLLEMDSHYLWHHLSPHQANPMIAVTGKDSWIEDIDGNRYFDGMSGLWCVNVGHGREDIARAAAEQMTRLAYVPLSHSHIPAIRLAEKVSRWLGGGFRIFFSNSGSDANEVAFKIARQYHQQNGQGTRYKFISRHRAYHGNSMGALGATGQAHRKTKYEPLGEGFKHVQPPYCYRCPFGQQLGQCELQCAKAIEEAIVWEGVETVAGVIMEPVITGGGVLVPHSDYLRKVREICDKYGVLLIVDEVICGFGRSGERFGHQNFDVRPDIVTMAKGITSAYSPLSATAVRDEIYEAFKASGHNGHFRHVNTFGGNPVSCAVALKNLEIIENERLVERAAEMGRKLAVLLEGLRLHPNVGDIRVFGFIAGIELVEDKESKEPAAPEKLAKVIAGCKERGVLIGKNSDTVPGFNNVLTLCPPFVTTDEELEHVVEALGQSLALLA